MAIGVDLTGALAVQDAAGAQDAAESSDSSSEIWCDDSSPIGIEDEGAKMAIGVDLTGALAVEDAAGAQDGGESTDSSSEEDLTGVLALEDGSIGGTPPAENHAKSTTLALEDQPLEDLGFHPSLAAQLERITANKDKEIAKLKRQATAEFSDARRSINELKRTSAMVQKQESELAEKQAEVDRLQLASDEKDKEMQQMQQGLCKDNTPEEDRLRLALDAKEKEMQQMQRDLDGALAASTGRVDHKSAEEMAELDQARRDGREKDEEIGRLRRELAESQMAMCDRSDRVSQLLGEAAAHAREVEAQRAESARLEVCLAEAAAESEVSCGTISTQRAELARLRGKLGGVSKALGSRCAAVARVQAVLGSSAAATPCTASALSPRSMPSATPRGGYTGLTPRQPQVKTPRGACL